MATEKKRSTRKGPQLVRPSKNANTVQKNRTETNPEREEKRPMLVAGMRADLEPQPKEDPDFGTGMEYEEGDRGPQAKARSEAADKIRQR